MEKHVFYTQNIANPTYFEENRLPAHSDHAYYVNLAELAAGRSTFRKSLNGVWYFHYARTLAARPEGFESPEYDCRTWDTIRVPAHVQMEGHGKPHYTNTPYPWDGHEPIRPGEIPQGYNPVSSYVTYFTKPEDWKEVLISFQGAETALAVWLNGTFVGYSEDTFTPADFDLTPYLVDGENKLAVQVYRFASGSWIEDQDFWRFSGLFREVYLYTKPAVHLEDMFVHAVPVDNYTAGDLSIDCHWNTELPRTTVVTLYDAEHNIVLCEKAEEAGTDTVFKAHLPKVNLWSAEHPYLYRALIEVFDGEGKLTEVIPQSIGFREFKMDPERHVMLINGKRIVFNGVNRHEFDCYNGRAFDPAAIEADVQFMKRQNINAVRTSHYPNASWLYDLCDRYGLYMIDEANLETHGSWMRNGKDFADQFAVPDNHPEWEQAVLARAKAMLERDKNHPAIVIWSCGNESHGGKDIYEMAEFYRHRDPSRLVHYESIFWDRRYPNTSDMESQMYTTVANILKFMDEHPDKPFICCEYTHSMGNSNGGMHKYTQMAIEKERYQGGFIWDFVDQAIWSRDRYGKPCFLYGGDFGDRPSDYNFSGNGILFADRKETSKLQDVKFNYQNFDLVPMKDSLRIVNRSLFTNVNAYDLVLTLAVDGKEVWKQAIDAPDIPAGEEGTIAIQIPDYGVGEYVLTASLVLPEATDWAEKGYEIAFGQGVFMQETPAEHDPVAAWLAKKPALEVHDRLTKTEPMRVVISDVNIGVYGDTFSAMFSSAQGTLTSYRYNDVELIEEKPQINFWRAPTDNDKGFRFQETTAQWKLASLYNHCAKIEILDDGGDGRHNGTMKAFFGERGIGEYKADHFRIRFIYALATAPAAECAVTYTVHNSGCIQVAMDYEKVEGLPAMPDFSMLFTLSADYDKIRYYGYGPADNYIDRQEGARLGIFETSTQEEFEPYLRPQEYGNHGGIRWFSVTDNRGRGLLVKALGTKLSASAVPYTPHEIESARHPYDLPEVHHTFVRASLGQCGVGGDDSWGAPILDEYIEKNASRHLEFCIKGI